ncbi:hypothetical protein DAPPUDRAFT_118655 [Daphnia pulex]|uniref:Uncharacterized protein n=1 Tax=Daphnia pulex TaxID=6669 RepID=E9HWA9_DAPPU|nr:hypothetical protein DAPPUDRAFT_118655 [Daphnia pulex]|eukprot:EFX63971.1 hypothetical protein DAPPUDRAFT_118655 [Daphnia pulex]
MFIFGRKESDIIKGKTVKKNGIDFFIPYAHWRLKTSAVPISGWSPTSAVDEYLLSQQASGGMTIGSLRTVEEATCRFVPFCGSSPTSAVDEHLSPQSSEAKAAVMNVPLPSAWFWVKDTVPNGWCCSKFVTFDTLTSTYAIQKRMRINFETLQVDLSVYGMECHTQDVIPKSFTNISNLSKAITKFNEMKICSGARLGHYDISQLTEVNNGILKHGTWRALSCPLLLANERRQICTLCSSFSKDIQKRLKRLTFRRRTKQNANYRYQTRELILQRVRQLSKRLKLANRKVKLAKLTVKDKRTILMVLKKSKCLNKKSMRYDADWLLDCLILRLKSKAAYDQLSTSKMIPIPHANTLRRLLSGMSTHFGYNTFALQAMKRTLSGLPSIQRVGSLVFDEMSIKEALKFNCQTFNFDGFLDTRCETGSTVLPALHTRLEDDGNRNLRTMHCWQHVEELYATDSSTVGGLQACSRLTPVHIHPTNMQKMNVSLAAQVLSKSVADLLQFYRTQDKDKELAERFRDTEGTEDFFRLINDTFNIMNGRCKKYGISRADWEGKKTRLRELLKHIDDSEYHAAGVEDPETDWVCPDPAPAFASALTLSTLRVSILSTIDLADELLDMGFEFVLTGKFNQDCIELEFAKIVYSRRDFSG